MSNSKHEAYSTSSGQMSIQSRVELEIKGKGEYVAKYLRNTYNLKYNIHRLQSNRVCVCVCVCVCLEVATPAVVPHGVGRNSPRQLKQSK